MRIEIPKNPNYRETTLVDLDTGYYLACTHVNPGSSLCERCRKKILSEVSYATNKS